VTVITRPPTVPIAGEQPTEPLPSSSPSWARPAPRSRCARRDREGCAARAMRTAGRAVGSWTRR